MSISDIKAIDWKHLDTRRIPQYIIIGAAMVLLGVLMLLAGFLL